MSVTCYYSGRMGNCIFSAATVIAYAKKHGIGFYLPEEANAYKGFTGDSKVPFYIKPTGEKPVRPYVYKEPNMAHGVPRYHEIPKMDNVLFDGYFQSTKFFSWCRDYILETFRFKYNFEEGMTSISVRRGDCVNSPNFPICPLEYYQNAVSFMQERGFNKFKIHSDDLDWCKASFTKENFGDAEMKFYEGYTEMENYLSLMGCENNITARSTFSLTAAWFNNNPAKIVCVPTTRHQWWRTQNADLIPSNFHQIDFVNQE